MTAAGQIAGLMAHSTMPVDERPSWLENAEGAIDFIRSNAKADYVVVYASTRAVWVYSVLAPSEVLEAADKKRLRDAHFNIGSTWCIQQATSYGERRIYLERPLESTFSEALRDGEPIVIRRDFSGMRGYRISTELNQRIVHALNLHWLPERKAYCELDDRGDLVDVIVVHEVSGKTAWDDITIVLIEAKRLSEFMAVSGQAMLRKFDFTRTEPESFHSWDGQVLGEHDSDGLFYHTGKVAGRASYANGVQLVQARTTVADMVADWIVADSKPREYETFKLLDIRNGSHVEVSCGPDGVRNYFTGGDKPYETSPIFFNREVLGRYRNDPDKYEVKDRSITCRNAWYLKSYDVNEEGQVHALACDIAALPIEEQRYWKLFNEWPKAFVSERSFKSDFLGEWSEPDGLQTVKYTIARWNDASPTWWTVREADIVDRALYPTTGSSKEWADDLLALDQLIVEGFSAKALRTIAGRLGVEIDKSWASLKVLEAVLTGTGMDEAFAAKTVEPLRRLNYLRNKTKGHAAPATRRALEQTAIKDHQTYLGHFQALATECAQSLTQIDASLASLA